MVLRIDNGSTFIAEGIFDPNLVNYNNAHTQIRIYLIIIKLSIIIQMRIMIVI